ncbi:nectin-2-like [Diretmus argenteus]
MAPASLSAVAGRPFTLGCNITMETHDTLRQVRWLNMDSKVLLAYEPGAPDRIITRRPDVELVASHSNASSITIKMARPNDEGCYRCVFDIYPSGAQEGKTCLSVTVKVNLEGNKTAVSGKPATLSCRYNLPERVRQVLWRKTAEQGDTASVASYAKHGHPTVEEPFRGRVSLSPSLGDTQLTIQPVRTEDEGCYTCEFHTYPEGTRSGTACLSVYVLPKPELTYTTSPKGDIKANCTTTSRPAAEITWSVSGENQTLVPLTSSSQDQGDGTTLVTSTVFLPSGTLNDLSVKCIVHHRGLEKPVSVALTTNVCIVAGILLLCLCLCLCKCFICTGAQASVSLFHCSHLLFFELWLQLYSPCAHTDSKCK